MQWIIISGSFIIIALIITIWIGRRFKPEFGIGIVIGLLIGIFLVLILLWGLWVEHYFIPGPRIWER